MNIVGAQVDTLFARAFPARLSTSIAMRLVFGDAELRTGHEVALRPLGPELEPLGQVGHGLSFDPEPDPSKAPGWEGSHLMATVVSFEADRPGLYTVEVLADGRHQHSLPYSVRPLDTLQR